MKIYELGNPPTQEQINRKKSNFRLLGFLYLADSLLIAIPFAAFADGSDLIAAMAVALLSLVVVADTRYKLSKFRELDAIQCECVAEMRDNSKAVQDYIAAVVAQGREVLLFEMDLIRRRVNEEEEADRRNKLYAPDSATYATKKTDDWEEF